MFRTFAGLTLWLLSAVLSTAVHSAPPVKAPVTITFAEQSVRLARGTSMYGAGRGATLKANDMVETAGGAIQLDAGGRAVAVGPASRFFVKNGAELILLDGWMKVAGSSKQALAVGSANVQLVDVAATVTLRAAGDSTELFAESADLMVNDIAAGKLQRRTRLPREHFAVRNGAQPLKILARPPAVFLSAMPRVFMDALVPVSVKGEPVPPKRERATTYAELAPWLAGQAALRQQLQRRFAPPRPARPTPGHFPTEQY